MTSPKACILAAVAGVVAVGAAWAQDSTSDLQQQVTELKNQVQQLQTRQAQNSKEVAATIESVLRDAEHRSQLMAAGDTGAGYDNGFYIRSGAFEMRPGLLFQFSNITDYRSNTAGNKDDELENGFEIHRLEFSLSGTAFTKDLTYNFMWAMGTAIDAGDSHTLTLLDAYITYMFADQWGFQAGQFTAPFTHENMLSDGSLLSADRSFLDGVLGGYTSRIQGMGLVYGNYSEKSPFNAIAVLHDGANSMNTSYTHTADNDPATVSSTYDGGPAFPVGKMFDWGFGARAEWKAMGKWADYGNLTAAGVKDNVLVLGLAGDWSQGGDTNVWGATADATFKMNNGLGVYGGIVYRKTDTKIGVDDGTGTNTGTGERNSDSPADWGLVLQASYLINPAWEIFGRWSYVEFDNGVTKGTDTQSSFNELTAGVNYYLGKNGSAMNRAKVTVELSWLVNGAPMPLEGLGYLGDNSFDNEIVLRGQFQLAL